MHDGDCHRLTAPQGTPLQMRAELPKPDPKNSAPCSSQKRCEHVVTQHAARILTPQPGIYAGKGGGIGRVEAGDHCHRSTLSDHMRLQRRGSWTVRATTDGVPIHSMGAYVAYEGCSRRRCDPRLRWVHCPHWVHLRFWNVRWCGLSITRGLQPEVTEVILFATGRHKHWLTTLEGLPGWQWRVRSMVGQGGKSNLHFLVSDQQDRPADCTPPGIAADPAAYSDMLDGAYYVALLKACGEESNLQTPD